MADRLADLRGDLRMKHYKKTKKRPRLLPSVRELAMPLDAKVAVRALTLSYARYFAERDDELLRTKMNKAYDAVLARLPETLFELEQAQAALRAACYGCDKVAHYYVDEERPDLAYSHALGCELEFETCGSKYGYYYSVEAYWPMSRSAPREPRMARFCGFEDAHATEAACGFRDASIPARPDLEGVAQLVLVLVPLWEQAMRADMMRNNPLRGPPPEPTYIYGERMKNAIDVSECAADLAEITARVLQAREDFKAMLRE